MTPLTIRRAHVLDAGPIAAFLQKLTGHGDAATLIDLLDESDLWHLAERDGPLLGVQWLGALPDLGADTAEIATFTVPGPDALAVGSALFEATRRTAKARRLSWLIATTNETNESARIYYRSRGFEPLSPAQDGRITLGFRL
ncbi:hypothetical protein JSE7799_01548 [Jannaschia seosinensis]|uniref:N-acetyltransferase domain-containing protein n=1 Tax=Jannaschia seosinensis TaxID=313367 RepID=A0A0M7B7Y7_9RHOB|nr:hypothetical protein [Jannaschia seosinensis]CUH38830.1 hypothetical protein JSE7799_01548 [Jannaschia seosinensis]